MKEGVRKYETRYEKGPELKWSDIVELNNWRQILYNFGMIGQDKNRYNGEGYGNVSMRLKPYDAPINERSFVITGSGTGSLKSLELQHYAVVLKYYPEKGEKGEIIESEENRNKRIMASSEAMTHGSIYDCNNLIRFAFHTHSQIIWRNSKRLRIPTTKENINYGTPEMTEEVRRLFRDTSIEKKGIFSMGGHEDGIFTFGKTADDAGETLLVYLELASQ